MRGGRVPPPAQLETPKVGRIESQIPAEAMVYNEANLNPLLVALEQNGRGSPRFSKLPRALY